jgi:hypothetical protein
MIKYFYLSYNAQQWFIGRTVIVMNGKAEEALKVVNK